MQFVRLRLTMLFCFLVMSALVLGCNSKSPGPMPGGEFQPGSSGTGVKVGNKILPPEPIGYKAPPVGPRAP